MTTYSHKELRPYADLFNFCIDVLTEAALNRAAQGLPVDSRQMLEDTADIAAKTTKIDRGFIVAGMKMILAERMEARKS